MITSMIAALSNRPPSARASAARRAVSAFVIAAFAVTSAPVSAQFGMTPPPVKDRNKSVLPELGEPSSDDLSPLQEKKLGEEIMRQAHEAGDVMEDPESTEYVNQFGENLVSHIGDGKAGPSGTWQTFRFFFVEDSGINAFALPGGYIGLNSGLVVATQSEAELASVMAHEMGHVLQRHIARGIAREKQMSMVALAATLLGILAATRATTSQAGQAAMTSGAALAVQDQLSFGRDAEREADRVGFGILENAGLDASAMATFFMRLQKATSPSDINIPSFFLTHPLTTERIADIQNRVRDSTYRQRPDSVDFQLVRARMRVLQAPTAQGMRDSRAFFEDQLKTRTYASEGAVHYGLAVVLLRQKDADGAQRELDRATTLLPGPNAILSNLAIDVRQAQGDAAGAVALAERARKTFPLSRMIAQNYADTLQQAGRHDEAIAYLRDQLRQYRGEPVLYELIAKSYAAKGDAMVSHRMLGEAYDLRGSVAAALEQMKIARNVAPPNADFYELSQVDARLRVLQARWDEIRKDEKKGRSAGL